MKYINSAVDDTTFRKMHKMKRDAGFGGESWNPFFRHLTKNISLVERFDEAITKGTRSNLAPLWMENFVMNLDLIVPPEYPDNKDKFSIGQLPKNEGPGLLVAAGPSIREKDHITLLAERGWKGKIFSCDRMLVPLLKAGVVPDYVASVDGNRELIVKWFEDPIVDEFADQIIGLFTTTGAPNAARRFHEAGGQIYWFHGMLDAFHELDSVTSFLNHMTGSTAVSCGGNVGSASWTLAQYIGHNPLVFIGLDLGYTPDTPIEDTAYYKTLDVPGSTIEHKQQFFESGENPDFGCEYFTDIVFKHYREALLQMVSLSGVRTINATEGGSVHGLGIEGIRFSKVLDEFGER